MATLAETLRTVVRGEVDDSADARDHYSRDASLFSVTPEVIVSPADAADVESVVQFAAERATAGERVSVTARAAGTGMSGGSLNDSIILDVTKHLHNIHLVAGGRAVVEPGAYFRDFDKETQSKGWELPSYTASREICTVGGMAANNSGGEKNLKYGKTERYVEELDVVLSDGKVHTLKRLEGEALTAKLAEDSLEGKLHREVDALIDTHRAAIQEAKPTVSKNSSGYAVWDIGSKRDGWMNLARLMVGAQGTLGIITKITFSLIRPKKQAAMAVIMVDDLQDLGVVIPTVLKLEPDSFESFDDKTFTLAFKYFPELAAQMGTGFFKLAWSLLPEAWMILTGGIPKLVLLVEYREDTQEAAQAKARQTVETVMQNLPKARARVAKDEAAMQKFWTIRRESFNLLRKKVRGKRTAPFIDDFVVPPSKLPEFLPKLESILERFDLTYTVAGHVGDGNFHIIPLMDPKRPDAEEIINALSHRVYDLVLAYDGSITGEHNDGLVRTPFVEEMFGAQVYQVFVQVKKLFDPLNIFNPGKKVGTTFAQSMEHLDLSIHQD